MQLAAQQLLNHLNADIYCYLFYGNDLFLLEENIQALKHFLAQQQVERLVLTLAEANHLGQASLFGHKRLIELTPPKSVQESQQLTELLANSVDTYFLLVVNNLTPALQKQMWLQWIAKHGLIVSHWTPTGQAFKTWLAQRAKNLNLLLNPALVEQLFQQTEGNCAIAAQELIQLQLQTQPGIALPIDQSHFTIQEFSEAILLQKPERIIKIITRLKSIDTPVQLVIWIINQLLRTVLKLHQVKPAEFKTILYAHGIQTRWHAFYLKFLPQLRYDRTIELYQQLRLADQQSKQNQVNLAWHHLFRISLQLGEAES